jgi:Na+-translocating ferredoxin:NAD+ oxidoreductase RnfG subunit
MKPHTFWAVPLAAIATSAPCYAVKYLEVSEAQRLCFKEATHFVSLSEFTEKKVWKAYSKSTFLGWFIVDNTIGKHQFITWCMALNTDGSIRQLEILEYREVYGNDIQNIKWKSQFIGKKPGSPLTFNKDIKNIAGSTISAKHITQGVKELLVFYEQHLKK